MSDELDNNRQELQRVQDQLKKGGVSRRRFLDSMKGLGVGFGAAFLLGMNKADAAANAGVQVKSTNPAIDHIVEEGQAQQSHDAAEGAEPNLQVAQYFRVYRRGYRRFYRRYRRFYRRGYNRFYRRGYRRFYARF